MFAQECSLIRSFVCQCDSFTHTHTHTESTWSFSSWSSSLLLCCHDYADYYHEPTDANKPLFAKKENYFPLQAKNQRRESSNPRVFSLFLFSPAKISTFFSNLFLFSTWQQSSISSSIKCVSLSLWRTQNKFALVSHLFSKSTQRKRKKQKGHKQFAFSFNFFSFSLSLFFCRIKLLLAQSCFIALICILIQQQKANWSRRILPAARFGSATGCFSSLLSLAFDFRSLLLFLSANQHNNSSSCCCWLLCRLLMMRVSSTLPVLLLLLHRTWTWSISLFFPFFHHHHSWVFAGEQNFRHRILRKLLFFQACKSRSLARLLLLN